MEPGSHPCEALIALEALDNWGSEDPTHFVSGLSHPDIRVARSAMEKLNVRIEHWPNLAPALYYANLQTLVDQLDRVPKELPTENGTLVRSIAARLYSTCISINDPQLQAAADACLRIVSSDATVGSRGGQQPFAALTRSIPQEPLPRYTDSEEVKSPAAAAELTARPEILQPTALPSLSNPSLVETQAVRSNHSLRLAKSSRQVIPPADSTAGLASMASQSMQESSLATDLLASDLPQPPPAPELPVMVSTPASIASHPVVRMKLVSDKPNLAGIEKAENAELIRLLGNANADVAKAASLALKHRGFQDSEIELASELAVGSAAQRIELIQQIAQANRIAPQPWLLWMAEDGQPEVRRMAVSLLSSMQNEEVQRALRMLLFREANPEIKDLIRKVLLNAAPRQSLSSIAK